MLDVDLTSSKYRGLEGENAYGREPDERLGASRPCRPPASCAPAPPARCGSPTRARRAGARSARPEDDARARACVASSQSAARHGEHERRREVVRVRRSCERHRAHRQRADAQTTGPRVAAHEPEHDRERREQERTSAGEPTMVPSPESGVAKDVTSPALPGRPDFARTTSACSPSSDVERHRQQQPCRERDDQRHGGGAASRGDHRGGEREPQRSGERHELHRGRRVGQPVPVQQHRERRQRAGRPGEAVRHGGCQARRARGRQSAATTSGSSSAERVQLDHRRETGDERRRRGVPPRRASPRPRDRSGDANTRQQNGERDVGAELDRHRPQPGRREPEQPTRRAPTSSGRSSRASEDEREQRRRRGRAARRSRGRPRACGRGRAAARRRTQPRGPSARRPPRAARRRRRRPRRTSVSGRPGWSTNVHRLARARGSAPSAGVARVRVGVRPPRRAQRLRGDDQRCDDERGRERQRRPHDAAHTPRGRAGQNPRRVSGATLNFQKAKTVIRSSSTPCRQRLMFVSPYVRG